MKFWGNNQLRDIILILISMIENLFSVFQQTSRTNSLAGILGIQMRRIQNHQSERGSVR